MSASGVATLIMSGIAIGGIIGSIFSTSIQKKYEDKDKERQAKLHEQDKRLKKHQLLHEERAKQIYKEIEIFNGYFQYTSQVTRNPNEKNKELQGKYYGLILLYLSNPEIEKVKSCQSWVNRFLEQDKTNDPIFQIQSSLISLAPFIRERIDSLLKEVEQG